MLDDAMLKSDNSWNKKLLRGEYASVVTVKMLWSSLSKSSSEKNIPKGSTFLKPGKDLFGKRKVQHNKKLS